MDSITKIGTKKNKKSNKNKKANETTSDGEKAGGIRDMLLSRNLSCLIKLSETEKEVKERASNMDNAMKLSLKSIL